MNLKVELKNERPISYEISIAEGAINRAYDFLKDYNTKGKIVVITDSNLFKLYPKIISLFEKKCNALIITIAAGEKSKSREEKARIEELLLKNKLDRRTMIVALGGGVVGDLAGFVSATFLRGIDYIQIPTTLLSMVDSSVGGKTAISTPSAKNVIGSFYHPRAVFIDPVFLKTLPQQEYISGLIEAIKMGLILDKDFFEFIENNLASILKHDPQVVKYVIRQSINLKAQTVTADWEEFGIRRILNYGHTIGHAIETLSDYKILHGEAVAIGIKYAGEIARQEGILKQSDLEKQNHLLNKLGLDLRLPKKMSPIKMIEIMRLDKKNSGAGINFVLIEKIGKVYKNNGEYVKNIKGLDILNILKG